MEWDDVIHVESLFILINFVIAFPGNLATTQLNSGPFNESFTREFPAASALLIVRSYYVKYFPAPSVLEGRRLSSQLSRIIAEVLC